jgi:hypothetical protein
MEAFCIQIAEILDDGIVTYFPVKLIGIMRCTLCKDLRPEGAGASSL